jgi:hypothetical protein
MQQPWQQQMGKHDGQQLPPPHPNMMMMMMMMMQLQSSQEIVFAHEEAMHERQLLERQRHEQDIGSAARN